MFATSARLKKKPYLSSYLAYSTWAYLRIPSEVIIAMKLLKKENTAVQLSA